MLSVRQGYNFLLMSNKHLDILFIKVSANPNSGTFFLQPLVCPEKFISLPAIPPQIAPLGQGGIAYY